MNRSETTRLFMRNLKAWLSGDPDLPDSKIIDLQEIVNGCKSFADYKIIKWSHGYDPADQIQYRLLDFIDNGGGLFCASTPWGYLQIYPDRTLIHMALHRFLTNFFGIVFTPHSLWLSDESSVSDNCAKHSQFDKALEKVTSNPQKIPKYLSTINCGLSQLNKEGILPIEKILDLKDMVLIECQNVGWNPVPSQRQPVRSFQEKNATNLLGQCLNLTKGFFLYFCLFRCLIKLISNLFSHSKVRKLQELKISRATTINYPSYSKMSESRCRQNSKNECRLDIICQLAFSCLFV